MQVNDRLFRSRDERVLAGVAGGVAQRFDVDPSLVRVAWVVLSLLTGGAFFLLYIVMAIVVPEAPGATDQWAAWQAAPGPGAVPGWGWQGGNQGPGPDMAAAAAAEGPEPGSTAPDGESREAVAAGEDGGPAPGMSGAGDTRWGSVPPSAPPPWAVPPRRHDRRGRSGAGTVIVGLILVLVGAYFLLRTLVPDLDLGPYWPVILIVIGGALLVGSIRPGSGSASSD
jgi:phage shock protein PspC (stress-responsive transcriptional regulator)